MDEKYREKVEAIKGILKQIHEGKDVSELQKEFEEVIKDVAPWEIPVIEQQLVREGLSPFQIAKMCDLHVNLFRKALVRRQELLELPAGHPLHTLMMENEQMARDAERLNLFARILDREEGFEAAKAQLVELLGIKKHFMKEQMLLFPYLERKGITAVPRVLWTKQDQLLVKIKRTLGEMGHKASKGEVAKQLEGISNEIMDMVFRENNILYPTMNVLMTEGEWAAVKEGEAEIGFYKVGPGDEWKPKERPIYPFEAVQVEPSKLDKMPAETRALLGMPDSAKLIREGDIALSEGYLRPEEIDGIFSTLPFDISFIDAEDRTRFYNKPRERYFPRTKTVLGRPVEFCHPPGSINIVQKIIEEFRAGRRDVAEFWIDMRGRKLHIRYFPVRGKDGKYLGTLEVVQDITDIKKIEGEKRLLGWR